MLNLGYNPPSPTEFEIDSDVYLDELFAEIDGRALQGVTPASPLSNIADFLKNHDDALAVAQLCRAEIDQPAWIANTLAANRYATHPELRAMYRAWVRS